MKFSAALERPVVLIAIGVIVFVCLAQWQRIGFLERLERVTYDERVQVAVRHNPPISTNLGFVEIRNASIDRVNQGEFGYQYGLYWPRDVYARATRELARQGAKTIAFDVLFPELRPDHKDLGFPGGVKISPDRFFADIIRKAGNVVLGGEERAVPADLFRTNAAGMGDISVEKDPLDGGVLRRVRAFRVYRLWHHLFKKVEQDPDYGIDLDRADLSHPGKIILNRSHDGTNVEPVVISLNAEGKFDVTDFIGDNIPAGWQRHQTPFTDIRVWHMGIVMAARELGLDLNQARVELDKGRITLAGTNGVSRVIPVDATGSFYINWAIPLNDSRLIRQPFDTLLDRDRQAGSTNTWENVFRNKTVVIGSTASGNDLTDRGATSLQSDTVLVSKHWNVANSVITNQFVRRAGLGVELGLICLLGVFTAVITAKMRRTLHAALCVLAALVLYLGVAFGVFTETRYWLPVVFPVIGGLGLMYVSETTYLVIFQDAEKRRVKGVFSKMVSPEVVNELLNLKHLSLGGARRTITVMFADIRGFTTLTDQNRERAAEYIKQHGLTGEAAEAVEDKSATDTLEIVNKYLAVVAEQVIRNQGTVDKFIGDCVMAFWGAPLANSQHALGAVRAAIGAQRAIFDLNRQHEEENRAINAHNLLLAAEGKPLLPLKPTLSMGSGINTGAVTAGLMGWEDHSISYTVFGREVNVASRLEGVSGHGRIIISEATLAQLLNHDNALAMSCVPLEAVNVKGIKDKVPIYEVPWRTGNYAAAPSAPASSTDTLMLTASTPEKPH